MRIVVLGDFQMKSSEKYITESAMEDVSRTSPDLVIALGDYGANDVLGRPQGIEQAHFYMSKIGSVVRPILGNHDLQFETGQNLLPHGTMSSKLCDLFGLENHHGIAEFERFRIFFISVDPQLADSCYYTQECYLTDQHFEELIANLEKRPGIPALFFTHAPPIGSGLMTVPHVHVRATNAYLDQNHNPYRWFQLFRHFPEIVLWFSAHYHLGHMHPGSRTDQFGTAFFMNGVHSNVTRDGQRQSRVIDIASDFIRVKTLDHVQRGIMDRVDWEYRGDIAGLVKRKSNIIMSEASENGTNLYNRLWTSLALTDPDTSIRITSDFVTGEGNITHVGIVEGGKDRLFAATDNGYLWEIDVEYETALGTLHYHEPPVKGMAVTGDLMWRIWEDKIEVSDLTDPFRFVREYPDEYHKGVCLILEEPAQCICTKSDTSVLIGCGNRLLEAVKHCKGITLKEIRAFKSTITQVACKAFGTFVRTAKDGRYFYNGSNQCVHRGSNEYLCDMLQQDKKPVFLSLDALPQTTAQGAKYHEEPENIQCLGIQHNQGLLILDGQLFFAGQGMKSWERIDMQGYKAASMCRMAGSCDTDRVCIAWNPAEGEKLPRFQIWKIKK